MESIQDFLGLILNIVIQAGGAAMLIGAAGSIYMAVTSVKRVRAGKATKTDALFLSTTAPGRSRYALFNSPDTMGIGVYAALALEQVGAIDDIKSHIDVNPTLYPEWPATYLSAARYCALVGDTQKANDYMSIATTLQGDRPSEINTPQLESKVVEEMIAKGMTAQSTTDLALIYDELRQRPLQLVLAYSARILFITLAIILVIVMVMIFANIIFQIVS